MRPSSPSLRNVTAAEALSPFQDGGMTARSTAVAARPSPLARQGRSIPPRFRIHSCYPAHRLEAYRKPIRWRGRCATRFLSLWERTAERQRRQVSHGIPLPSGEDSRAPARQVRGSSITGADFTRPSSPFAALAYFSRREKNAWHFEAPLSWGSPTSGCHAQPQEPSLRKPVGHWPVDRPEMGAASVGLDYDYVRGGAAEGFRGVDLLDSRWGHYEGARGCGSGDVGVVVGAGA